MQVLNAGYPVNPAAPLEPYSGGPTIYVGGNIPISPNKDEDILVGSGLILVAVIMIKLVVDHAPDVFRNLREKFDERERLLPHRHNVSSLEGIGGWLLAFLCFAIYNHFGSVYLLIRLMAETHYYQSGVLVAYKLAAISVLLLWSWMLVLILGRSRKFLTAATVAVCASVLLEAFRLYLGAIDSIIMIVVFVASLAYFYSSKRVANTYVT